MNKSEMRIIAKIVHEINLYFMLHNIHDFTVRTKINEDVTEFIVRVKDLKIDMLNKIEEKVSRERELEVETYGWELLGDVDQKSELDILGLLIDTVVIKENKESHTITLRRLNRYTKKK